MIKSIKNYKNETKTKYKDPRILFSPSPPPLCVVVLVGNSWWGWWWWGPRRSRSSTRSPPSPSSPTPSISCPATSVSEWAGCSARSLLGRNSWTSSRRMNLFFFDHWRQRSCCHRRLSLLHHCCSCHVAHLSNCHQLLTLSPLLLCNHRSHWVSRRNIEYFQAWTCHGFHFPQLFHSPFFPKAFHFQQWWGLLRVLLHHAKQCWHLRCWKLPLLLLAAADFAAADFAAVGLVVVGFSSGGQLPCEDSLALS